MLNNSVSNKSFIIKTLLYGSAITVIVVALLLGFFMPQNLVYADTEESYINFNQLFNANTSDNTNYVVVDNNYTISIIQTTNNTIHVKLERLQFLVGHKYFIGVNSYFDNWNAFVYNGQGIKYFRESNIYTPTQTNYVDYLYIYANETTKTFSLKIIDLTQCFGESIANNLTINDINNLFPSPYYSYTLSNLLPLSSLTNQEYYNKGYKDGQAQNNNIVYSSNVSNISLDNESGQNVDFIGNLNYNGSITYTSYNNEKFWRIYLNGITLITATKYTIKWEYLTAPSNFEYAILRYTDNNYSNEVADIFKNSSGELSFYYDSNYDFEWISLDLRTTDDNGIANITFKLTITAVNDISMAYDLGYEDGEDAGYNTGYSVGYDKGYNDGNFNGIQHNTNTLNGSFWSFLSSMFSSISNLLHIELYDGITIGVVIMIPLLFTILMLILKLVRG